VSTGADGLRRTATERIVMKESVKSTTCFLADVMATAPAAISLSYKENPAKLLRLLILEINGTHEESHLSYFV